MVQQGLEEFLQVINLQILFKCLFKANMCNHPYSKNRTDGLKLYNTYITTALKCVPPGDKPTTLELKNCFSIFDKELMFLEKKELLLL